MHASVHASTTHAMCISRICACLFFSQCATLSPNVPHGIIDVPKGEWEERTHCPMTIQSASRSMQGCPALQPAINLSLSITISPVVCLPFASLILAIKIVHTSTPKDAFSSKPRMPIFLHVPSGSLTLPLISNLLVTALHDPVADKINASAF